MTQISEYTKKRIIVNFLINSSAILNEKISAHGEEFLTELKNSRTQENTSIGLYGITAILLLDLKIIKLKPENTEILIKIKTLLSNDVKKLLENIFLKLYRTNFLERSLFWKENDFEHIKLQYIEKEIAAIDNFFNSKIENQTELINKFFKTELMLQFKRIFKDTEMNPETSTEFHLPDFEKKVNEIKSDIENLDNAKSVKDFAYSLLDQNIILQNEIGEKEIYSMIVDEEDSLIDYILNMFPIDEIIKDVKISKETIFEGISVKSSKFNYLYIPYFKAVGSFRNVLEQEKQNFQIALNYDKNAKNKEIVNSVLTELINIDTKTIPQLLVEFIRNQEECIPYLDKSEIPEIKKIPADLNVGDLALLFRLLVEEKILKPQNKTDLYQAISLIFQTKNATDLSPKSIKNKFEAPELKSHEFWDTKLTNLKVQNRSLKQK